jgi:hypothetical protein
VTAGCYRALVSRSSSPAAILGRASAAAGIVIAALSLAGCQSTANGQAILTDPAEILMAGARSTAALHTVHARMDMTFQTAPGQGLGGGMQVAGRMSEELDADLDTRSFAGRTVTSVQGMPDMTSDMILVGGQQFSRNAPETRWTLFPQFGAPVALPSNDQLVEALSAVIEGGGVDLQLAEQQACGDVTCYHVIASIDPAVEWQLLAPLVGAGAPPAGLDLPPITIHLLIDQPTRHLAGGNTQLSFQGISASVTFSLTNPDAEITIAAPPPALVDNMGNGFGGGIITNVGGGVAPVPMPAESIPPDELVPPVEEPLPSS